MIAFSDLVLARANKFQPMTQLDVIGDGIAAAEHWGAPVQELERLRRRWNQIYDQLYVGGKKVA